MKTLLQLTIITVLIMSFSLCPGQEFKQEAGSTKLVFIKQISGKIKLTEHVGNQIVITANGYVKKEVPNKAEGLKQINVNGVDNTNIGLYMTQQGDALEFTSVDNNGKPISYHFKIPKGMDVKIDDNKSFLSPGAANDFFDDSEGVYLKEVDDDTIVNKEDVFLIEGDKYVFEKYEEQENEKKTREVNAGIIINNFSSELEVKTLYEGVDLRNVTGPLTINSRSGFIAIEFLSVNQSAPITITSMNGEIDVAMPANSKTNIQLNSMSGDIYSDFDIDIEEKTKDSDHPFIGGGSTINGTINGGGVDIMLKSISDNIYLRKK